MTFAASQGAIFYASKLEHLPFETLSFESTS